MGINGRREEKITISFVRCVFVSYSAFSFECECEYPVPLSVCAWDSGVMIPGDCDMRRENGVKRREIAII